MSVKKDYVSPQIYRVELNHEQAILSACSVSAANAKAGGASVTCRSGGCKADKAGGSSDNAFRPS